MSSSRSTAFMTLGIMGFTLPLIFVAVAIAYSPWFNIVNNALSDLGHAIRSSVAPIFNLGLSLGGFIMSAHAIYYILPVSKLFGYLLCFSGYSIILIGMFDEAYGVLHFMVSVVFFLSLAAFMIAYAVRNESPWAAVGVGTGITFWVLHFGYDVPKGAAIPELISIAVFIPFYLKLLHNFRLKALRGGGNPSVVVDRPGFEPGTSRMPTERSSRLSYRPVK